jgi:elongation factor 2
MKRRSGRTDLSHLYKKFVNERVTSLVGETRRIRNCTVIAHIDHGKTTLTDSLIASSGLLSKEVAASARLLDYDQIEQQRGITIKASGISLIHKMKEKEHLIHLIDTPGHIDFSSHVTRGLRLTDGAVIVIDIIEGIMVQTETVTRQAMQEMVRPILFVNKIDRLINERKLTPNKIAKEVDKTVREFNAMLGKYLDDDILEKWEVSFNRESLCVGSGLDKWGFGISVLRERVENNISTNLSEAFIGILEEIVDSYRNEAEKELSEKYPVANVILDSLLQTIPSPNAAQKYRVPIFWRGNQKSTEGKKLLTCNKDGSCILLVGNVLPDRHAGTVATVRVLSGTMKRAEPLRNLRTSQTSKSLQVGLYMSKTRVALSEVPAGNLAFITGLKDVAIGDTLVSDEITQLEPMLGLQYPMEAVVTYAVEPRKLSELSLITEPISNFAETDPALEFLVNPDTGEMLLSGAGELHIEVSIQKLARQGINIVPGKPMVILREQMMTDGDSCSAGNELTSEFTVYTQVRRDDVDLESLGVILYTDPRSDSYLVDGTNKIDQYSENTDWIREAFKTVIESGPYKGERMRKVVLVIEKANIRNEAPETSWRDITQPLLEATRSSISSGNPKVLEPWIRLEISTPEEHVGVLTGILARRKGQVFEIDSERSLYRIDAEIPVRESFGLATEIRTSTSGWATWGAKPGSFREIGVLE